MTRRDFELVAKAMSDLWKYEIINDKTAFVDACLLMANRLSTTNDNFKKDVFLKACMVVK